MKGKTLLLLFALLFVIPSFAQKPDKNKAARHKEIMEFKLDFLAKEIDLKEDQVKQFNELYMQLDKERRVILKRIKTAEKTVSENKDASEAVYEKAMKEISSAKNDMIQTDKKYDEKFSTFLTKKQMYKLKEAENAFMKKMQQCCEKKKKEKR